MMIAQRLYEGVELGEEGLVGLITYMRTDSVRVSNEAWPKSANTSNRNTVINICRKGRMLTKKRRQRRRRTKPYAHIAMRHPDQVKQYLKEDEYKVYTLIWQRFVAPR